MFKDRLDHLMDQLGATATAIAAAGDIDRTGVSRLRSGSRKPKPYSITTLKLLHAIRSYAEQEGKTAQLCSIIGCEKDLPAEELETALLEWIFEGDEEMLFGTEPDNKALYFNSFAKKLDAVMRLTDLTNSQLARTINVDASLISRFRTGARTPRTNLNLAILMGNYLFQRTRKLDKLAELSALSSIPVEEISEEKFLSWLCDYKKILDTNASSAEALFKSFDSYSSEARVHLPSFAEAAPNELLTDSRERYFGTEGLRDAVVRFLGNVVLSGEKELLLYSDQNMTWMTADLSFRLQWASLMSECVKKGVRIRIIHNIDRNMDEMNAAINSWLPLYMSGMIEPYYCRRKNDGRFSHTLFLCPGFACIHACHVIGTESHGLYYYDTAPEMLSLKEREYQKLLSKSNPLVQVNASQLHDFPNGGVSVISNNLSIATMSEELVHTFNSHFLHEIWKWQNAVLHSTLRNDYVIEYFPIAKNYRLCENKLPVEKTKGTENLFYSSEQYAMHLKNILALSEKYPHYHPILIPNAMFYHIKIMIGHDSVLVCRTDAPYQTFRFVQTDMRTAFLSYVNKLTELYSIQKDNAQSLLRQYLD